MKTGMVDQFLHLTLFYGGFDIVRDCTEDASDTKQQIQKYHSIGVHANTERGRRTISLQRRTTNENHDIHNGCWTIMEHDNFKWKAM
jgi:hypothetical protein